MIFSFINRQTQNQTGLRTQYSSWIHADIYPV